MMAMREATSTHAANLGRVLRLEPFYGLAEELWQWREIGQAGVFSFAKGLHLSARLIYAIRPLVAPQFHVDWGQLLTPYGDSCSPECDIIVYRNGYVQRWNGNETPVMDFRFVNAANAVAVISCKSLVRSVDTDYCKSLRPYVRNVFLFGECCASTRVARLKRDAMAAGYRGFWYLYAMEKGDQKSVDDRVWEDFLKAVQSVVKTHRRSR